MVRRYRIRSICGTARASTALPLLASLMKKPTMLTALDVGCALVEAQRRGDFGASGGRLGGGLGGGGGFGVGGRDGREACLGCDGILGA